MRVHSFSWAGDAVPTSGSDPTDAQLVLYFASRAAMADGAAHRRLQGCFPEATLLGCSTGGHALSDDIHDDGGVGVALRFDSTTLRLAYEDDADPDGSRDCGRRLGERLVGPGLSGVLLLSDGLHVNGSALATGLAEALGPDVPVSGGLAGDGAEFGTTLIGAGDALPAPRRVAALGLYGAAVRLAHGSGGGWERFGPERRITRASGNTLLELDGAAALDLYERYLGDEAEGLPGTALLYPLRIWDPRQPEHAVVRTVLAVDRAARSMTFAGDMPQGWKAQLMRGGIDRLAAGAAEAARNAAANCPGGGDSLAILVSCIGRRLLMGQRTGEELEAVAAQFAPRTPMLAFYSYGEVSPRPGDGACELHNQTMTVTVLREAA